MNALATGYAAALVHGRSKWLRTERYQCERLERLLLATAHLRELSPLFENDPSYQSLLALLEKSRHALEEGLPSELPFLSSPPGAPQRLRVATALREWLLSSRHPRQIANLRDFLEGYQNVSPLHPAEVQIIKLALQLALAEKCHLLPSPRISPHVELLPRLLRRLAETAKLVSETDWSSLSETVSRLHLLSQKEDPSAPSKK